MRKFLLRVMPIILVAVFVLATPLFAVEDIGNGNQVTEVVNITNKFFATAKVLIQSAAVLAVIVAGVRYMFASADGKADIKQQTIILVVGAILVFAAVPILNWVTNIGSGLFGN